MEPQVNAIHHELELEASGPPSVDRSTEQDEDAAGCLVPRPLRAPTPARRLGGRDRLRRRRR